MPKTDKIQRIKNNECIKNGMYIENLGTYIGGLFICLLPMFTIGAIILAIAYLVLRLMTSGSED